MLWSGNGVPFVETPVSPNIGSVSPGVVFAVPGSGMNRAGRSSPRGLLVSVNAVEPAPFTSTYQMPLVRKGGTMIAEAVVNGIRVEEVASDGRLSRRARREARPDDWVRSSFQP